MMNTPPILAIVEGERVAPEVPAYVGDVYAAVVRREEAPAVVESVRRLLTFLTSPTGRTHANCWAVDAFFMHNERWEADWEYLPEPLQDVLADLGGALHDTVQDPSIAENFDSTPELLLRRLDAPSDTKPAI